MSDATCTKTRDIGKHIRPGLVVLTCGRKPRHHRTPEGDCEWWGGADDDARPDGAPA